MSESDYLIVQIGAKIRQLRKSSGLTLNDIAEKSGVSTPMLSKIENGRVIPTLSSLIDILNTLQVDLNQFFKDFGHNGNFPGYIFQKRKEYQPFDKEEESEGFQYEFIHNHIIEKSSVDVVLLTLAPNAKRDRVSTAGLEYIFIVQGEVEYELGDKMFKMHTGDSLFFDGTIPHVPHNCTEQSAIMLVVYFITL